MAKNRTGGLTHPKSVFFTLISLVINCNSSWKQQSC